ncbi:MAG: type II CAAX endopeptidase family protein [Bacillota bacterium]|nr:type II CAAX endopeptidase family protein [Bacillota bacterium]
MKEKEGFIVLITVIMAFIFWYFSFVLEWGNFWLKIAISASMLAFISLARMSMEREKPFELRLSQVFIGVVSAVLLYWIFVLGRWFLEEIIPFTAGEIQGVYAFREGTSLGLIVFLLLIITGPAEEIYWRGYLQKYLINRLGPWRGLLLTAIIYSSVHIWTLNVSLILASFIAGLFWGFLYHTQKNLLSPVISHAIWGLLIFVLFPVV